MYLLYIEAVAESTKAHAGGGGTDAGDGARRTRACAGARCGIADVLAEPDDCSMGSSLCPPIFGARGRQGGEPTLGLFGGALTRSRPRADVHVLVVGDPGMGKSQMLTAVAALARRAACTCAATRRPRRG